MSSTSVLFSMLCFYLLLHSKPFVFFYFLFLVFSKWLNADNSGGVQGDTGSTGSSGYDRERGSRD